MKQFLYLENFEYKWFSQDYEEGIIEEIFFHIGTSSKYYVEFGAIDGFHASNTRRLREEFGWSGLLLDRDHENPSINLYKAFISSENIHSLFIKYEVPYEFDLLSIDIDYNDFYIWNTLDINYRPRLIVIEYNAIHPPWEDKVVPYNPQAVWDGTNYFGASILALFNLGRKKGYSLIYADSQGANLFFVRNDLLLTMKNVCFKNVNEVEKIYKPPNYGGKGTEGNHKEDPYNRPYLPSKAIISC